MCTTVNRDPWGLATGRDETSVKSGEVLGRGERHTWLNWRETAVAQPRAENRA